MDKGCKQIFCLFWICSESGANAERALSCESAVAWSRGTSRVPRHRRKGGVEQGRGSMGHRSTGIPTHPLHSGHPELRPEPAANLPKPIRILTELRHASVLHTSMRNKRRAFRYLPATCCVYNTQQTRLGGGVISNFNTHIKIHNFLFKSNVHSNLY